MLKSAFFGVVIVESNQKQLSEIKRIYKRSIIDKLKLGQNFPKSLLYVRELFLGVEFLEPETVLAIATLKVYIRYKQARRNITKLISINEEIVEVNSRLNKS